MSSIAASFTTDAGPVRSYASNLGVATRAFLAALIAAKPAVASAVVIKDESEPFLCDRYDFLKRDSAMVHSIFSVRPR